MPVRLILAALVACSLLAGSLRSHSVATAGVPLRYVALGDSLTALPGYVQLNAANMETDLGANVTIVNLGVAGWTSLELRGALSSNRAFRAEVAEADVVTIGIGMNDLNNAVVRHLLGTCGGADQQDCLREAVATFKANYDVIDARLQALAAGRAAVRRPWDVYNPYASDGPMGAVMAPYWAEVNAHIAARAADAGLPLAGVAAAFNGAAGDESPAAKGYLQPDGLHLSEAGSAAIAAIFRANGWGNVAADEDGDDVADRVDNCPGLANPLQENADNDVVELSSWGKAFDDYTQPNSDGMGDACDDDDDNDGLSDALESALHTGACPLASAPTDPRSIDTDGDGVTDSAECVLGADPADPGLVPVGVDPDSDGDRDGLPDGVEILIGTDQHDPDTDGDGVLDGIEVRRFASNPMRIDTDDDGCPDGIEVGSVNADRTANALDMSQLAQAYGPGIAPSYVSYFDWNSDNTINAIDLMFASRFFGVCGG